MSIPGELTQYWGNGGLRTGGNDEAATASFLSEAGMPWSEPAAVAWEVAGADDDDVLLCTTGATVRLYEWLEFDDGAPCVWLEDSTRAEDCALFESDQRCTWPSTGVLREEDKVDAEVVAAPCGCVLDAGKELEA